MSLAKKLSIQTNFNRQNFSSLPQSPPNICYGEPVENNNITINRRYYNNRNDISDLSNIYQTNNTFSRSRIYPYQRYTQSL